MKEGLLRQKTAAQRQKPGFVERLGFILYRKRLIIVKEGDMM